jgi:hypothetical protein
MDEKSEFCLNISGSEVDWRNRDFRELFEINEFINHFKRLHEIQLFIHAKSEKPDYFLQINNTKDLVGVELTSVYISNYSVPHFHMKDEFECIPYDEEKLFLYGQRIINAIKTKVQKATAGYDKTYPLYLSVYINEYISVYMDKEYWLNLINHNKTDFTNIQPFDEVLFWPLANNNALSIKPNGNIEIK